MPRRSSKAPLLAFMSGAAVGLILSLLRESLAQFPPFVVLDAVGLWAFYLSHNFVLASIVSVVYFAGGFCFISSMVQSRGFKVGAVMLVVLVAIHVVLVWRLDVALASPLGQVPRLLFQR